MVTFKDWFKTLGVLPRLTSVEIWNAAIESAIDLCKDHDCRDYPEDIAEKLEKLLET